MVRVPTLANRFVVETGELVVVQVGVKQIADEAVEAFGRQVAHSPVYKLGGSGRIGAGLSDIAHLHAETTPIWPSVALSERWVKAINNISKTNLIETRKFSLVYFILRQPKTLLIHRLQPLLDTDLTTQPMRA